MFQTLIIRLAMICLLIGPGVMLRAQEAFEEDAQSLVLPPIELRTFDADKRNAYLEDEAYLYDRDKLDKYNRDNAGAENRARSGLADFLFKDRIGDTSLIEILLYLAGIFGLLFFAITILKVDIRGIFSKEAKRTVLDFEELQEDIRELDFEQLIAQARQNRQYRRAVRLMYLETLKELSGHKLINWQINKTNQDYLDELQASPFQDDFYDLTLRYEYVWYGDFPVGETGFRSMERTFRKFQRQLSPVKG